MNSYIIGERIRIILFTKNIKRSYVAMRLGISYNTLTKKIQGKREFSYIEVCKLKDILELSDELAIKVFFDPNFDIEKNLLTSHNSTEY